MKSGTTRRNGSLDPSFGVDGRFTFDNETFPKMGLGGATVAADGKILVAGRMTFEGEYLGNVYAVARLNEDGKLDEGFGNGKPGLVIGQFATDKESFGDMVIQTANGKLVLSGVYLTDFLEEFASSLARFNGRGELDASFGVGGVVILKFPAPFDVPGKSRPKEVRPRNDVDRYSVHVTSLDNGKLILSGAIEVDRTNPDVSFSVLARLNEDGSLDKSFGNEGAGYVYLLGRGSFADSHMVLPEGKILVCGHQQKSGVSRAYVCRYSMDGTIDTTFGGSGWIFPEMFGDAGGYVVAMCVLGDGQILLAGNKVVGGSVGENGVLVSVTYDGKPDSEFNKGMPVDIALGTSSFHCRLTDILPDGDGVVLVGWMGNMALFRYLFTGQPDTAFGNKNGWWEYPANQTCTLTRTPDGKMIASAWAINFEKYVARFLGERVGPDPSK